MHRGNEHMHCLLEAGGVPPVKGIKDFTWAGCTPHNGHFEVMQLSFLAGGHVVKQAQVDCGNARLCQSLETSPACCICFCHPSKVCKH